MSIRRARLCSKVAGFLIVSLFAVHGGQAANIDSPADNAAWTGEPSGKASASVGPSPPAVNAAPPTKPAPPPLPVSETNAASANVVPPLPSHVATLSIADLREYAAQSPPVRQLLTQALALTALDLSYQYGSSDPKQGGMDCSGTVYYLLKAAGFNDVPRDASEMYQWVWTHSRFEAVNSSNPGTFELGLLKPGDLLFWTGTYHVDRDPPITHVMIYLGINRHTGRRVMVGASEGRRFNGKSEYGVSVFDFTMPGRKHSSDNTAALEDAARFIGYGSIPGLEEKGAVH